MSQDSDNDIDNQDLDQLDQEEKYYYSSDSDTKENSDENDTDKDTDEDDTNDYNEILSKIFSCEHYYNKCKVICDKCSKCYGCHKCHNIAITKLYFNSDKKTEHKISEHYIEPKHINKIVCMNCKNEQKFSNKCNKCGDKFSKYICNKCKIMTNRNNNYQHCNKCNMCYCYLGKKTDYKHCSKCNQCVLKKSHICKSNNINITEKDCSVCQTNINSDISLIMKCNHIMHMDCYNILIKNTYKCPECLKSICDTRDIFSKIREEINMTVLNDELKKSVKILCNDCDSMSDVEFHYIGNECKQCNSFNTIVV